MDFTTMDAQLGRRLADEKSSKFNELSRIDAVNNAMLRISNLLDNDMLEELRTTQTVVPTTGSYALSGLTTAIVRNGLEKVYDVTNVKWLHLVDPRDLEKENNMYLAPGTNYGIAYVYGANLIIDPHSASVTVYYLGQPTPYIQGDNEDDECPLNGGLHPLVLDLAEAELWKMDGKGEKALAIMNIVNAELSTLNARAEAERKEVLGRKQ